LKHLDKFYNKRDIPWVKLIWNTYYANGEIPHAAKDKGSFWWRDIIRLCDEYRAVANCKIGDGATVLFWSDAWNDLLLERKFPRLYSYAKNKNISVARFILNNRIEDQFHLPLSSFLGISTVTQILQNLQVHNSSRHGNIYRETPNTQQQVSTTTHSNTFTPPPLQIRAYGSGTQNT
jgi:hypothetical protein